MRNWEAKVERVIGKFAYASWHQANHDRSGRRYKRHRPYSIPDEARRLVEILGLRDRTAAERAAKSYMEGLRRLGFNID